MAVARATAVGFVVIAGLGFGLGPQPPGPTIAVLEYPQCAMDATLAVRPLFFKAGDSWTPLSSVEAAKGTDLRDSSWTVASDGRSIGSVHTVDPGFTSPYAWTYPRDRRLSLEGTPHPPTLANPGGAFAGWCSSPPTRPLVLVTPANFQDPDVWKPFSPTPSVRQRLFADFKKATGPVVHCSKEDPARAVAFAYIPAQIVIRKSYRDRAGRMLIALQLDDRMNGCDGPRRVEWSAHWFLVGDRIQPLGHGFELVDAGDYDGDGKSEILFWYSGYDEDGYSLFYDGLARHADFRWIYH